MVKAVIKAQFLDPAGTMKHMGSHALRWGPNGLDRFSGVRPIIIIILLFRTIKTAHKANTLYKDTVRNTKYSNTIKSV